MRSSALFLLTFLSTTSALAAQSDSPQRFRFDFGVGAGDFRHETDSSNFDGDTDGGFARLRFEGVSRSGFGGGLRLESWGSDDDLFQNEGFTAQEAFARDFYGHFTFRAGRDNFMMPIRVGLMLNQYELEGASSGTTTLEVTTIGPRFEVAPEFTFNRGSIVEVSAYGEMGFGAGYSSIEIGTLSADFDSASLLWGFEFGARARYRFAELGLAFVSHGMVMEESDAVGSTFVNGFGAGFTGVMFTAAFVF